MTRRWHFDRAVDLLSGHTIGLSKLEAFWLIWDHLCSVVLP